MRSRLLPLLAAALLVFGGARKASAGDEHPADSAAETRTAVEASLARLQSPFYAEREAGVADLIAAGSDARAAILAAFKSGTADVRPLLVRVLAADGSPEALDALLRALPDATDASTSTAIQTSLVEHAERVGDAVRAWRDEKTGKVPPRVAELAWLLDRARVEMRFLSKKSQSGGTGSYPGQFKDLADDGSRRLALDVCLGILGNRAPKLPGRYPAGAYRFLRPPPFFVSPDELRAMSIHAISELAQPTDEDVIAELKTLRAELEREVADKGRFRASVEASFSDGILATLAKLRPNDEADVGDEDVRSTTWRRLALQKISELRRAPDFLDDAAALAMQLGEFESAVALYEELRDLNRGAIPAYNLACAYARWSLAPGRYDPKRLRSQAIEAITSAVESGGYADWSWMEQDGDLNPIRDDPRFRSLVERMKADNLPRPTPAPTRKRR